MVVEDEIILAMDISAVIEDSGHHVIAEAASLREVQAVPPSTSLDLAFVDMQLAEGSNGLDVCAHILTHWPAAIVVFVTANPKKIPDDFAGAHGVVPKPFSRNGLKEAIRYIEEGICDPPPVQQRSDFHASPAFATLRASRS
ncbi:MAG: response regulator [Janthinobacterium lividum]